MDASRFSLHVRRAALVGLLWTGISLAPAASDAWKLAWSDEFNGPTIDPSKWDFEVNALGGYNNELQYYTDRQENARIENGCLVIEARAEKYTGPEGTRNYTSARMRTLHRAEWKYGRIEVRARLPKTQGLWPAIWMLPTDSPYGGWPHSGEIDIMELLGHEPAKVYGTLHYADSRTGVHLYTGSNYTLPNGTFADDFHTFALEWEPKAIRWYVDDVLYSTQTNWQTDKAAYPAPFDQKFHLLLNVAVGGDWPGNPNGSSVFPQRMVVDYVRVFQAVPTSVAAPSITVQPVPAQIGPHANITFSVVATGGLPISYQWYKGGAAIPDATKASFTIANTASSDAGTYRAVVTNPFGSANSDTASLTIIGDPFTPPEATFINLSARAQVGTSSNVLIAGFVIGGIGAKKLLIRAVGPGLANYGVAGTLRDPVLTLTKPNGTVILTNDDWSLGESPAELDTVMRSQTFPFPAQSNDAAMIVSLPAGSYTAVVSGSENGTGVALAELYDLEPSSASRLINLSVRGRVGTDADVMIAGFGVAGQGQCSALVRAVGPTLTEYSVSDALADPMLELSRLGGPVLATNDNWADRPADAAAITAAAQGFPLATASRDAALLTSQSAGAYTAVVSGVGRSSGVALVEVYELP